MPVPAPRGLRWPAALLVVLLAAACRRDPSPPGRAGSGRAGEDAGKAEGRSDAAGPSRRGLDRPRPKSKAEGPAPAGRKRPPTVLFDRRSPFSHVQVLERGSVRILAFVQDNGARWPQTKLDLSRPHEPAMPYLRGMLLSLAYVPKPRRVLLVGLGGGAAVHLLRHRVPGVRIVAVEIDPVVVEAARAHFRLPEDDRLQVVVDDALRYVPASSARFDLVWLDAFLDPSGEDTDAAGVPRPLSTVEFLRAVAGRLAPKGVAVFNLHHKSSLAPHLAAIEVAFGAVHLYKVPNTGHRIAIAGRGRLPDDRTLARRADAVDAAARRRTPPSRAAIVPLLRHRIAPPPPAP